MAAGKRLAAKIKLNRSQRRASLNLRGKLILLFTVTIVFTVAAVVILLSANTTHAYLSMDEQRSQALASAFRQEFSRQFEEVGERTKRVASSEAMLQLTVALSRSAPDYSQFADAAARLPADELDVVDLLTPQGTIIASKHWPARFGYKDSWFNPALSGTGAFLQTIETADGSGLAILSAERTGVGEQSFYLVAGKRLDSRFLQSFAPPPGTSVFLYRPSESGPGTLLGAEPLDPQRTGALEHVALKAASSRESASELTNWNAEQQMVRASPLFDRQQATAAVLLVVNSEAGLQQLTRRMQLLAALVAAAGIVAGILLSIMIAARFTRPVEELAAAAGEVAAGNLTVKVDESRTDEVGRLAQAFNRMTRELIEEREKLVQSERVAAWRELARRLAHELKNPLFPLQITVENLMRAREQQPEHFDEVFRESAATLLHEIENVKTIINRFSDFSKMPAPERQSISINEAVRKAMRVYEPQFCSKGRPLITARWDLDPKLDSTSVSADPELLHRALSNLVLNAMDAMPKGGYITARTKRENGRIRIELADTGTGITEEERKRLFTPYYTSKQHGTGLGLAIVQSVVSDHQGKVWAESEPGKGSTFIIELPSGNQDGA
jgi:signal transduction histidine kinase